MTTKKKTTKKTGAKTTEATSAPKAEKGRSLKRKPVESKKAAPKKAEPATAKSAATSAVAKPEIKPEAVPAPMPTEVRLGSLAELRDLFCKHLVTIGKSEGTARSYAADLQAAMKHFGADKMVAAITEDEARGYIESDGVNLARSGERRNQITIDKVVRVFRQALEFAATIEWIDKSPLPAYERKARKPKVAEAEAASQEAGE